MSKSIHLSVVLQTIDVLDWIEKMITHARIVDASLLSNHFNNFNDANDNKYNPFYFYGI